MTKQRFDDFLFDAHVPVAFIWFFVGLLLSGATRNTTIYCWTMVPLLVFLSFCICYFYIDYKTIKFWWRSLFKYKLTGREVELWGTIEKKVNDGFIEWYAKTQGDDLCGPWIANITPEETSLIEKIHEKYYGKDWWIAMPIGVAQVSYIQYQNIKDKIYY